MLRLHYNGSNSFLFLNATKIYKLKAKISEEKRYLFSLGIISKDFTASNMKKTGLSGYVYDFSVDYSIINNSNIIDIHRYFMKKHNAK